MTPVSPFVFVIKPVVVGKLDLFFFILALQCLAFQMIHNGRTHECMLEPMLLNGFDVVIV